jgi:inositol-hexakisphosphate kinase
VAGPSITIDVRRLMSPSQSVPENAAPPDALRPSIIQGPSSSWLRVQQQLQQLQDRQPQPQHQPQKPDRVQVQALAQEQQQQQEEEHAWRHHKKMHHNSSYKNASSSTPAVTARSPPLSPLPPTVPPSSSSSSSFQSPSAPPWPLHHPLTSRPVLASLLTLALAADSSDTGPSPQTDDDLSPGSRETTPTPESEARRNELTRTHPTTRMMVVAPTTAGDVRGTGLLGAVAPSDQFFPYDRHDAAARARPDHPNGHHRGRGTSLERTEKERRVQVSPNGASLRNAGDTALASPHLQRRSPTPADVIAKSPPTEGVRATYRAWRYPLPSVAAEKAWSINERGGDDQGGRVEKLITDAMAGVEPNNRSRKASHSLGFFKEGLPEDRTKKREARGRGRSKDGLSPVKTLRGVDVGKKLQDPFTRDPVHHLQVGDIPSEDGNWSSTEDGQPAPLPMPGQVDLGLNSARGLSMEEGYVDLATDIEVPREQVRALPPQLLAEIRKHHNLTPGATKGTSFSRSLPVAVSERPRDEDEGSEVKSFESGEKDGDSNGEGTELSPVKSADEEDESGEEQISSALFLPHQSTRDSSDGDDNVFESVPDHRAEERRSVDVSNLQRWLEQYEVPSRDRSPRDLLSRTVPVTSPVRVKPPSSYAERESVASQSGDVSGAEQEILDDSGYTTAGEDLIDDRVLSPVGSLKPEGFLPSGTSRHVSDELPDPERPLEAIELIPYRHQVGGHTTMWRFSKRAVCKQLTNRENEFYEKIERYHPQLLKFLPRFV